MDNMHKTLHTVQFAHAVIIIEILITRNVMGKVRQWSLLTLLYACLTVLTLTAVRNPLLLGSRPDFLSPVSS